MPELPENCCGCAGCAAACPKNCIAMLPNREGFLFPSVDKSSCINCGACEAACPVLNPPALSADTRCLAARCRNEDTRLASSSGGIFSLLADSVLAGGGVVFGAAFTEDFTVAHTGTDRAEGLAGMRTSKYVQSRENGCFRQAEKALAEGRKVMYSGTPCQVAGLKAYLGHDYENLLTQDLVCHSVPSPLVWKAYLKYREDLAGGAANAVSFRKKERGVPNYKTHISFDNGKVYESGGGDPYMSAFLDGLCSRRSCYDCRFKGVERASDITLADFWGGDRLCPELYDGAGLSLVFLHSEKGRTAFEKIEDEVFLCAADADAALKFNPMALRSPEMPPGRKLFISRVARKGFPRAYGMARRPAFALRARRVLKRLLSSLKKPRN